MTDPVETVPAIKRGVLPTAKLLSAAGTMVVLYVLRQFIDVDPELEQIVNLVVPLIVAYLVPNAPTPGGAPDAEPEIQPAGWGHGRANEREES